MVITQLKNMSVFQVTHKWSYFLLSSILVVQSITVYKHIMYLIIQREIYN